MRPWIKWSLIATGGLVGSCAVASGVSYLVADKPSVAATVTGDASLPSLEIKGVQLHLDTFGDPESPTLIGLHGGPGNDYRHLLPLGRLSDDYHVVLYDQRGAGLSERVADEAITLESLLGELDVIARHFSPDKPVRIVGHSWGAMLGASYLERHPQRVSHLALLEPGFLDQEGADHFLQAINGGVPDLSLALLSRLWGLAFESLKVDGPDDDAAIDHFVLQLATSPLPGSPMAGYFCEGNFTPNKFDHFRMGARASIALQRSGFDEDRSLTVRFVGPVAKNYNRPVLLVGSSCNTIIGYEDQKRNVRLFGNAKLARIEGAGHMMIQERPDEVLRVLRDYLSAP